jgi:methyl-accepting chemotaxis protein
MGIQRWLNDRSIRGKFLILNVVLGVLLAGIGGYAAVRLLRAAAINQVSIRTTDTINDLSDLRYEFATLRGRHISVLMAPDQPECVKSRMDMARSNEQSIAKMLEALEKDAWRPDERALWDPTRKSLEAYLGEFNTRLRGGLGTQSTLKERLDLGRKDMDAARKGLDDLLNMVAQHNQNGLQAASGILGSTLTWVIGLALSGILFGSLLTWFVGREVTRGTAHLLGRMDALARGDLGARCDLGSQDEIGRMAVAFNEVAESLSGILEDIGRISERTAAGSMQLSATADEMLGVIQSITRDAEHQRTSVQDSRGVLTRMEAAVEEVAMASGSAVEEATASRQAGEGGIRSVHESTRAMGAIRESSEKVGSINRVISEMANQTNLLSLNAAIEAAKAGEAGRGFSVVADEVRELAERSADAAREIDQLLRESAGRVEAGVGAVHSVDTALKDIGQGIQNSSRQIERISVSMEGQKAAMGQLVSAFTTLSAVSEQNASATTELASSMEETRRTIEELAGLASQMRGLTERFQRR